MALPVSAAAQISMARSSPQASASAEVEALVRKVAAAYAVNDLAAYFSYFDDDIMVWNGPNARWVKQDYVTRWTKVVGEGGGVSSLAIEDLQMRVSPKGDAVVATFAMPVIGRKGGLPAATEPTVMYHMTEAWFKRGGRWSMAHMHWSARTPAKP
ncbi:nuclear transport factor 2 family protein [Novosphingobium sp. Chol11]|uniref:nuclear transport factor 2 family protein n=1 Tax=Novosphingobium sp. Chol11 TaxID=1385763 RepID=UPI0025D9C453|nr:nuclear transport factor 2 family protein [Novosphingobium sp. Chol11]